MTDYQKLKKCFDEIGVIYSSNEGIKEKWLIIESTFDDHFLQIVFDESYKYKDVDGNY